MAENLKRYGRWKWLAIVALIVVGVFIVIEFVCYTPTTVIVLRHAERDDTVPNRPDNDVPLSASGQARAATLAQVAARAGVTRIYVTEKLRTQQTAAPLASAVGLTPTQIAAADVIALVGELQARSNRGRVIVVVGHSDTVPDIVNRLGGGAVTVGANQFDNLFVLTLHRFGTTRIIQATYGDPR